MSERFEKEGWGAPKRGPLIAAAATLLVLLTALLVGGHFYKRDLQGSTHAPLMPFPKPQLETIQTPPTKPRADFHQPAPASIGRAMRDTAAQGDALWREGK